MFPPSTALSCILLDNNEKGRRKITRAIAKMSDELTTKFIESGQAFNTTEKCLQTPQ